MYRSWNYSNETEMFVPARHWRLRKRACLPNNFSNRSFSKRVVGNEQKEWECEVGNFKQQKYNSKGINMNNHIKLQPMEEASNVLEHNQNDRFRWLVGKKLKDADVEEKLREVCELSLSFAPSSPTIPKSEKKGYICPRFDDLRLSHPTFIRTSKISKTNSTTNNNHINLDLTISTS
ncbi:hypothetical protein CCACVL1_02362 [Corchorus capsularis]|uniref:Uncharacterized protein n=1 Tax=Corchorus capsularis TaxID=210143 RepID=A0A1R3K919_COCAP|nr:hypothetical protein CCACVL1_02362 [Corchorus capsularis]